MFTILDINSLIEPKYRLEIDKEKLKDYRLKYHYSKVEYNSQLIHHIDTLKQYKSLYKLIRQKVKYLNYLIAYSKDKRLNDYATVHHNYYFFASNRYLARRYKGTSSTWNRNINLFVTLGLINRISEETLDIANGELLKTSLKYKSKQLKKLNLPNNNLMVSDGQTMKMIGYYTIPLYTVELLSQADDIAKKMIYNNYRSNSFNKMFLINVFGQEFANKVFQDEREITDYSNYVSSQIYNSILSDIDKNGYTTKDRVINLTEIKCEGSSKNILTTEYDRCISELKDKYGLEYRKANKELKEKFKLDGYKTIIFQS